MPPRSWHGNPSGKTFSVRRMSEGTRSADEDGGFGPVDERVVAWRPKTASDLDRAISKDDQMRDLAEIRRADPNGIGRVPVSVLREHATIVDEAFQAFFKRVAKGGTPGFPRFKGFDQVVTLECPFGDGISFGKAHTSLNDDGSITACRLASMMWTGGLKVRLHRPLPSKPKRVSLTYDGRFWWVSFLVEVPDVHVPHPMPGTVAGADVGVNRLVTLDDGSYFENPRFLLAGSKDVAAASRRLAKAKRGSRARQKARKALSAAHRRVRNRRNTWRHTVAKRLARTAETIVFEELKLRNMIRSASGTHEAPGTGVAQKRGLNRVLSDAGLAAIVNTTRHKAESAGGRVLLVDPRNSSLECSRCGTLSRKVVYERHLCPACGLELHRDHNAAIVIRDRGIAILGAGHRPRRGARSTGPKEDAGRHRPTGPERKGKHRRDDVASLAAFGRKG
jgi:putative transposase